MSMLTMLWCGFSDPFPVIGSGRANLECRRRSRRRAVRIDFVPPHGIPMEVAMAFSWETLHLASHERFGAIHCGGGNSFN